MPGMPPTEFPWSFLPTPQPGERLTGYFTWPDPVLDGLQWPYFAFRGREIGPTVVISAAIHGGEYPGPLGALRLAHAIDATELRGSLLILPMINLPSFWARTAFTTPNDGKNLNRAFPGDRNGTFCEVLAYRLMTEVVASANALVDLHSGDIFEALADHVIGYHSDDPAIDALNVRMLNAFGLPYGNIYPMPRNSRGFAGNAVLKGTAAILVEMGCNGLASEADVAAVHDGLINTLRTLGALPGQPTPTNTLILSPAAQVVAPATGLWRSAVVLEQEVAAGDTLGTIVDLLGETLAEVAAPADGMVLYYMTSLAVHKGDPLVNLVTKED